MKEDKKEERLSVAFVVLNALFCTVMMKCVETQMDIRFLC